MAANPIIYVVDDGADYRFLLKQVFSRFLLDFRVHFFESGAGLRHHILTDISSPTPDVCPAFILLDLHMPGLTGFQTLVLLKQQPDWKQVPVVMMTSEGSDEEIQQCYDAGANSFILKPVEFLALKNALTDICQYWTRLNYMAHP